MTASISYSLYVRRFDCRRVPARVDIGRQQIAPDADRGNVVELRRVRALRAFLRRCRETFGALNKETR